MFTQMYNTLYKHPVIGFVSGLASSICMEVNHWLTDELLLKTVSGIGVWAGAVVAVLSAVIYGIKLYDIIKRRLKKSDAINNQA